jgi:molybdate transport system ATP-binding protein
MTLAVEIHHRIGRFTLDVRFSAGSGLTALFGRSGSGKTSTVNAIGGLVRPERGRIAVDDTILLDTERRIFMPPHRRRIGYIFQEGRLFPHLTVRQNLLYGRWFSPRDARYLGLEQIVDLLGIGHLLDRRPAGLSGGEKQRVAIGRALLASPRLLLMDEPLAALDDQRKAEILPFIERLRDELRIPIVYVSHSLREVTRLATTLVLIADGRVQAAGSPVELMSRLDLRPATGRYEAGALLEGHIGRHDNVLELTTLATTAGELRVPLLDLPAGTPIRVRVRARDVMLALAPPEGFSALNVLAGRVAELAPPDGAIVEVALSCGQGRLLARITRYSVERLGLRPGLAVFAVIKSVAIDHRSLGLAGPAHDADPAEIEA